MPLEVKFNPGQLEVNLQQIGERAVKGMSERMRRTAMKIRDLAREYAPVKTGQLEKSIDYETLKVNGRNSYVVFIDLDMVRQSGEGVVGDYAFVMEEELHPYGRAKSGKRYYRLGPGSAAKAASGKKVGGRFLSRAVKEGVKGLLGDMAAEVRRVTNSSRSIPMSTQRIEVEE
jgi:hypothetical protein